MVCYRSNRMSRHFQYLSIQNWHKTAEYKPKHLHVFLPDAYQLVMGKEMCLFSNRESMAHKIKVCIKLIFQNHYLR